MNRPFFGDNLGWLRDPKEFPDETLDLLYLDPPFNSNADYNVLFREDSGVASQAKLIRPARQTFSRRTGETDCLAAFAVAGNLPVAETLARNSCPHYEPAGRTKAGVKML